MFKFLTKAAFAFAAMLLVSGVAQAQTVVRITGSPHDLSQSTKYTGLNLTTKAGSNQICLPCHAPHGGETQIDALLWNHKADATQQYTLGGSGSMTKLDTSSKMCLSCHDGNFALDAFGGSDGTAGKTITGSALLGTDLSKDHPVGASYRGTSTDGKTWTGVPSYFVDPTTWTGTSNPKMVKLADGTYGVGCTTCHNPHTYTYGFVRMDNSRSALCLKCHVK